MDVFFINYKSMKAFIDLASSYQKHQKEMEESIQKVLLSGEYIGGSMVQSLEKELSSYTQSPYVVTCGSGTDALMLALKAFGLKPGDQVIVPDFSFIAPAETVRFLGGEPIFCDIDEYFLIDTHSLESWIGPKTKGIIAVNLFGQCADYEALSLIAEKHGLWMIEDAAQSFGAQQRNIYSCNLASISITSFYPTKTLSIYGDGGAVFCKSKFHADFIRAMANHGSTERYKHKYIGINSRLDSLQAAILQVKLQYFQEELLLRKSKVEHYNQFFKDYDFITAPAIKEYNTSSYAQYTLRVSSRDQFIKVLEKAEIPYQIYYPIALSHQACFSDLLQNPENKNTLQACQEVLSLPLCAYTNVEAITEKLKKALA
jgi:UDP-2-acetamido-2-deoxy-ribo-hexuluronate aminotransferase